MPQPQQIHTLAADQGSVTLAETQEAGNIEAIPINELKVDFAYQRDISNDLIQRMSASWDMAVAGPIVVSRRPNGEVYIVDGQHRAAAAKLAGESHILAQVIEGLEQPTEAEMRLKGNVRRSDKAQERFRAQLAAGDEQSKAIVEIAESFDTRINYYPDASTGINCVSAIEQIYKRNRGVMLARVMEVIQRAWGNVSGKNATVAVFKGIAWMIEKHEGELDIGRLVDRLQAEGVESIDRKARAHKAAMGGSMWLNWYRAAVEVYNQKLPEGSRLQWSQGKWTKADVSTEA